MEHQVQQELASGSPEVPNYPGYVCLRFGFCLRFYRFNTHNRVNATASASKDCMILAPKIDIT